MEPKLKKEPLTPAQKRVFDAIVKHISINRFPPSVRELCRDLGYSSPNAVTGFLRHLERKHWIKRPSTSRGIVIL